MIVNLLRDQLHAEPSADWLNPSSPTALGRTITMNSDGIVRQTFGSASLIPQNILVSANTWRSIGVLITQPVVDKTPYRVKMYSYSTAMEMWIIAGYAPQSPTGTNDQITSVVKYPVGYKEGMRVFDDVIGWPALPDTDPDSERPLAIGVAFGRFVDSGVDATISVQNLAQTAPQFASSVS